MERSLNDKEAKNREIVKSLREAFAPVREQLTPEVEPALTYLPFLRASRHPSSAKNQNNRDDRS